jgi:hypothetical protein
MSSVGWKNTDFVVGDNVYLGNLLVLNKNNNDVSMNCNKVNTQEINISNKQAVGSTKVDVLPNDAQFDNEAIVNKINELIGVLKNTGLLKE